MTRKAMPVPSGRTVICSAVFVDIVGYTKVPTSRQLAMKARLNQIIGDALSDFAETDRLVLDTGDGAAICFLGDPEDALFVATAVNRETGQTDDEARFVLRTGINLGPIKLVTDLNGQPNAIGDGINVAQRVMSFAAEGEILVSRSYYEVVARLRQDSDGMFRFLGTRKDKHVREHQIYSYGAVFDAPSPVARPDETPEPAEPVMAAETALGQDLIDDVEHRLAARIGPLARVVVRRAADTAVSRHQFFETVAACVPDEADRAAFLAEAGAAPTAPAAMPLAGAPADDAAQAPIAEEDRRQAERLLADHLGPLAKFLVTKTAAQARDRQDLYRRLAAHIDDPAARARFLAAGGAGN
ncbi:MAG: hypothetical protein ACTS3R_11885 [Inquilinaceae bacterium]